MAEARQQVFQQLKPPCVNLSSVILKFRTKNASVKDVLQALDAVRDVLQRLGKDGQLDPKLAEYAFFPLAQQVFNETKRLSSRCLEVAIECVTLLVQYGYRSAIQPELGKQLLLLMSMLAGAGPSGPAESPSDEMKIAAFSCMSAVVDALTKSRNGYSVFADQASKSVVDQMVYLLLEAITDNPLDTVQVLASELLLDLLRAIESRVFLASLLPRTASSLTKALKLTTKARRTQKVLATNVKVLRYIIDNTLADRVALEPQTQQEKEVLDKSWLKATGAQVKNVLLQVYKLRNHDGAHVRRSIEELCVTIIEDCQKSLQDCIDISLETLVVLAAQPDGESARNTCRHLLITYPETTEMLRSSFSSWSRSLPRQMHVQDERAKQRALQRLSSTLPLLTESFVDVRVLIDDLMPTLIDCVSNMISDSAPKPMLLPDVEDVSLRNLTRSEQAKSHDFLPLLMTHESQREVTSNLYDLVRAIRQSPECLHAAKMLVDSVDASEGTPRLAALWLSLQILSADSTTSSTIDDLLLLDSEDHHLTRATLLADLNSIVLPTLSSVFEPDDHPANQWQTQALAMEVVLLHAQTFSGEDYRPELVDTLYPILSFLASSNAMLRNHSVAALDKLAQACKYSSTKELLIANVDYLVNSVAWKLDTYSLSPEAPQILRMMTYLCGPELVPYLDDLIQSIFAALDNYHGYPEWVELLFDALKSMVDVSIAQPQLVITSGKPRPSHNKAIARNCTPSDILDDVRARKRRKLEFSRPADEPPTKTPHRPWTSDLDGPTFPKPVEEPTDEEDIDTTIQNEESGDGHLAPLKHSTDDSEPPKPGKTHTLLLNIATSTVPHLASPSPRVRQLLLGLLRDISPLLSRDETSYLPLINAIWPVVVPRLFATDGGDIGEETAYNIAAAAETVAVLCENAGDFMASRIEDISTQLMRLFKNITSQVELGSLSKSRTAAPQHSVARTSTRDDGAQLVGAVDLQVVKQSTDTAVASLAPHPSALTSNRTTLRTSKSQILQSLITLLLSVLKNVQVTLDTGDAIMHLLLPLMAYRDGMEIRAVLENYNPDAVWLFDLKVEIASGGDGGGFVDPPALRRELVDAGMNLRPVAVII